MADFPISALPSETLTSDTLLLGSMPDGLGGYDSGKFEAQDISGIVVKHMTQTDYDNLSPAEKNNGTLYITDGTPPSATVTGSDVLYFTDVSDSNAPKSTTAAAVAGLALDRLKIKTIPITGSGTLWSGHYYYDADISSSFTGDESTAIIIAIMSGTATNGGILQLMKQGDRTIRLLDSQAFTNVTVNALVLYYVP